MSEDIVQLPPDGIGKKIRAIKKTVGANDVYMEGNVPYDEAGVGLYDDGPPAGEGRKALKEELLRKEFSNYNILYNGGSLKGFWLGRTADYSGVEPNKLVDPDEVWLPHPTSPINTLSITCPAEGLVEVIAKHPLPYPEMNIRAKLPDLSGLPVGYGLWFAFEHGTEHTGGLVGLFYRWNGAAEELRAYYDAYQLNDRYVDLTALLPADHQTAQHLYSVKVHRNFSEFLIDQVIVGYAIPGQSFQTIAGPPYGILITDAIPSTKPNALIELAAGVGGAEFTLEADAYFASVYEGEAVPPRVLRLYETGTNNLFAGKAVAAGTLVSHPIPIFGYEGKTLYFRADQNSTANNLIIQILTQAGNWRNYDAVTYTADDDWFYTIAGEAVLARLSYTPAAYPAAVAEGEAVLR